MVRSRSRRHHRRRTKSPVSPVSLPATLLGVAVLAYFAVQLATNPTAHTAKRNIVERPVTTEISATLPDNQLSKHQAQAQAPPPPPVEQAQAQTNLSNEQPGTAANDREQPAAPYAPVSQHVDTSIPAPPAAPVVPPPQAAEGDGGGPLPQSATASAADTAKQTTPVDSAPVAQAHPPTGESNPTTPDTPPVPPRASAATSASESVPGAQSVTPVTPQEQPVAPPAAVVPESKAPSSEGAVSAGATSAESKPPASEATPQVNAVPAGATSHEAPAPAAAPPSTTPPPTAKKERKPGDLITSPLAMDVPPTPAAAPKPAAQAATSVGDATAKEASGNGNASIKATNTTGTAVAQGDANTESKKSEDDEDGEKNNTPPDAGIAGGNNTNEAEGQSEAASDAVAAAVGESEDESAIAKMANEALGEEGSAKGSGDVSGEGSEGGESESTGTGAGVSDADAASAGVSGESGTGEDADSGAEGAVGAEASENSGNSTDEASGGPEAEEAEGKTGVTAIGTKNHNVSHASVEVKHGKYTLQVPRGARVTGKLPDFMGVVPARGGMIRGMNVTRVSYALYKIVKLFGFTSLMDAPAGSHTDWMSEMLTRVEFDRPAFKYIGVDSNCTSLVAAKDAVGVMGNADFKCVDVTDDELPTGYDVLFYWPDLNTGGERDPANEAYGRHIEAVMKNAKLRNNTYIVVPQYPSQRKPVRYRYGRWVFDTDGEDGAPFVMNEHMKGVVPVEQKQTKDSYLLYLTFYSLYQMQFY